MIEIPTAPSSAINGFRISASAFACLLGCLAAWILIPELLRRATIEFPTDAQSAASAYAYRDDATIAARVGFVRGDLWTQAAFAYGDFLWNEKESSPDANVTLFDSARSLTLRAVRFAPHDARLWLLLAAINLRFDWLDDRASADLRMSYYTGSNVITLVPTRLMLAVQAQALREEDFQELVRHDIRIAVTHKSELLPALISAYNNAPQGGQQFMQETLSDLDPSILKLIYSRGK